MQQLHTIYPLYTSVYALQCVSLFMKLLLRTFASLASSIFFFTNSIGLISSAGATFLTVSSSLSQSVDKVSAGFFFSLLLLFF